MSMDKRAVQSNLLQCSSCILEKQLKQLPTNFDQTLIEGPLLIPTTILVIIDIRRSVTSTY